MSVSKWFSTFIGTIGLTGAALMAAKTAGVEGTELIPPWLTLTSFIAVFVSNGLNIAIPDVKIVSKK